MTHDEIVKAIMNLAPGAEWSLNGDNLEDLIWSSPDIVQPTYQKIQQEINKPTISAEAEAKATARQAILNRLGLTAEEAALLLGGN